MTGDPKVHFVFILAFLHGLSKKIPDNFKEGSLKSPWRSEKSRTQYICFCRLLIQCILPFSCQRFLCHWNLWHWIVKSPAILNHSSFFIVFRRLPTRAAKSLSLKMRNLLSFVTYSITRLQGKMALVQRKEIKSSNVWGETLQDTTDTFTGSVRKFIYFISIFEM